jgi:hypothetical protein
MYVDPKVHIKSNAIFMSNSVIFKETLENQ